MDTIIGLGKAGCAIADKFSEYSQYFVYKMDIGLKRTSRTFPLERYENHEDYEKKMPPLGDFFSDVEGEVLFIVGGGGRVSSSCLAILEHLKHCKINILYIRPDRTFLGADAKLLDNMAFGVLQEYTRSGVFEKIFLIDNQVLDSILPGTSIKKYYDSLNEMIASTIHMLNKFNHTEPVLYSLGGGTPIGARICTIGVVNLEKNQDKDFFNLDNVTDVGYYYAYNTKKLEESCGLYKEIKDGIKVKLDHFKRVMYGVYETDYEQDYCYCVKYTSIIQEMHSEEL